MWRSFLKARRVCAIFVCPGCCDPDPNPAFAGAGSLPISPDDIAALPSVKSFFVAERKVVDMPC
jgi:hypothetical protein